MKTLWGETARRRRRSKRNVATPTSKISYSITGSDDCASNTKKGRYTMPDDMYRDYEEQIAFQYTQQQPRHHRDAQRLTNTTNAALPNRAQRAAAQRQAETEARQRNLRTNSRVPPDGLPRGRGRNHDDDYATAQPPRSALRHRPTNGADLEAIPGVQFHTH